MIAPSPLVQAVRLACGISLLPADIDPSNPHLGRTGSRIANLGLADRLETRSAKDLRCRLGFKRRLREQKTAWSMAAQYQAPAGFEIQASDAHNERTSTLNWHRIRHRSDVVKPNRRLKPHHILGPDSRRPMRKPVIDARRSECLEIRTGVLT